MVWKVPANIEREVMFKSNQRTLRITETPKSGLAAKSDGFTQMARKSELEAEIHPSESSRKAWYEKDKSKPEIDFSRDTLPDWAKSTVGFGDNCDEADFIYQPKGDVKISTTHSDDDENVEDENQEDDKNDFGYTLQSKVEISEFGEENSNEDGDAFDFEQSRIRKTTNSSELMLRQSRIGDIIRKSVDIRQSVRAPGTKPIVQPVPKQKSTELAEIQEISISKEDTNRIAKLNEKAIRMQNSNEKPPKPVPIQKVGTHVSNENSRNNPTGELKIDLGNGIQRSQTIDVMLNGDDDDLSENEDKIDFDQLVNEKHSTFRHATSTKLQKIKSEEKSYECDSELRDMGELNHNLKSAIESIQK